MSLWIPWTFYDILDHFDSRPCEKYRDVEVDFQEIRKYWGTEDGDHVRRCWDRTFTRQMRVIDTLRNAIDVVTGRYDVPAMIEDFDLSQPAGSFPIDWPFPGKCVWREREYPHWNVDCLRATNEVQFSKTLGCCDSCGTYGLGHIASLIDLLDFHQKSDYDKFIGETELLIKKGELKHGVI